jgi:hypothetical protein
MRGSYSGFTALAKFEKSPSVGMTNRQRAPLSDAHTAPTARFSSALARLRISLVDRTTALLLYAVRDSAELLHHALERHLK